jgi:hypothetical protein
MTETHVSAVAITASEWRALIGYGELRLARRRVQQLTKPVAAKESNRLFSWTPTTVLGDGNDLLVLDLVEDWASMTRKHPAHPSELLVIPVGAVKTHHCVGAAYHAYLSGEADREGVLLEHGQYDAVWSQWVAEQSTSHELTTAQELLNAFGIDMDIRRKRPDGYVWLDIIRLAKNSKTAVKSQPKQVESLLRAVRGISTAISGVHGSTAYDIAANVEWIAVRTGRDPLKKKALREQIDKALESASQSPWSARGSESESSIEAIKLLEVTYPKVYTGEITPSTVSHVVRQVMAAKDRTLQPVDFIGSIHALNGSSRDAAALLCVAVSGALGPLISKRLIKSLQMVNPVDLDWETF